MIDDCERRWYFTMTGVNEKLDSWYWNVKSMYAPNGMAVWAEFNRFGSPAYTAHGLVDVMRLVAFDIAAATGLSIEDHIDYDGIWKVEDPEIRIVMYDATDPGVGRLVMEAFNSNIVSKRAKKAMLKAEYDQMHPDRNIPDWVKQGKSGPGPVAMRTLGDDQP